MKKIFLLISIVLISVFQSFGFNQNIRTGTVKPSKTNEVQLEKGKVDIYDFGEIKVHAYATNDLMNDYVLILEKNKKAVMIESPAFFDNFSELNEYILDRGIKIKGMLIPYHPFGAKFLDEPSMKGVKVYSTERVINYWSNGYGAVMAEGIPKAFGDKLDSSFYDNMTMITEGRLSIAGINMNLIRTVDGFDVTIPSINTVYVHILNHDGHSEILSADHLISSIEDLKMYIAHNYQTFLSSHHAPETKLNAIEKLTYLKEMKSIASESSSESEFFSRMQSTYPKYNDRYLSTTAKRLFPNKIKEGVNVFATYVVKPGQLANFKDAFKKNLVNSLKEEGNLEMRLYQSENDENVLFLYSRWKTKEAYIKHKNTSYSKNLAKVGEKLLVKEPVKLYVDELDND